MTVLHTRFGVAVVLSLAALVGCGGGSDKGAKSAADEAGRGADKVEVVGISVDDEKAGVAEFAKENGATFAIGRDEGYSIAQRWKVEKMPTTFIVDGSGTVRYIHAGYHDGEAAVMEKELATLVDEAPSGGTRVAKNDRDESKSEAKEESNGTSKSDAKSDAVATTSNDEE
jgi:AhpC/TSA family